MTYQLPEPAITTTAFNCNSKATRYYTSAQMQAAYAAGVAGSKWQPIDTAPKDGKWRLVYRNGTVHQAKWLGERKGFGGDGWCFDLKTNITNGFNNQPTHWMPLPDAPNEDMSDLSALRGIQGVGL